MNYTEQRDQQDRRHRFHPFNMHAINGRRCKQRRGNDVLLEEHGIDRYPDELLFITLAILFLCALDAHNTLVILSLGGTEINPLMDYLIQTDLHLFVASKFALTSLGVLLFVGYHHILLWKLIKVRYILYSLLALYLLLIGYQWILLAR